MTEAEIGWACQQLVAKTGRAVDANRPDDLRDVYAPDAVQHVRGMIQQGVDMIVEAVKAPLRERILAHLMGPTVVTVDPDGDTARGTTTVTVFRGARKDAVLPLPVEGPGGVAVYHDRFRLTGAGWRIAERTVELVFGG